MQCKHCLLENGKKVEFDFIIFFHIWESLRNNWLEILRNHERPSRLLCEHSGDTCRSTNFFKESKRVPTRIGLQWVYEEFSQTIVKSPDIRIGTRNFVVPRWQCSNTTPDFRSMSGNRTFLSWYVRKVSGFIRKLSKMSDNWPEVLIYVCAVNTKVLHWSHLHNLRQCVNNHV